jgi:hypothetical protein
VHLPAFGRLGIRGRESEQGGERQSSKMFPHFSSSKSGFTKSYPRSQQLRQLPFV